MRSVVIPEEATSFEAPLECDHCHTSFVGETSDLQYARFVTGGYEFAGTATYAGRFFVDCPGCRGHIFVDESLVGVLLQKELIAKDRRH
jgi:hypothetical protein